jgi:anti-anti-sigma regulatory factor
MLKVSVENLGEAVVLRCQGALVRGEESSLLCAALGNYGQDIIVDLAEVEAIDGAGSGALLVLQAAGVYMRLQNSSGSVRELLRAKSMEPLFETLETKSVPEASQENQEQFSVRAA